MRNSPASGKVATVERTLVLCKPDAMARGLVGRVIQRFEDALLTTVGMKMVWPTPELVGRHYHDVTERHDVAAYAATVQFMCSGPVVALVLEALGVVDKVRSMIGVTWPQVAAAGTIRGDFAHQPRALHHTAANLVHASATVAEARTEIELWFRPDELHPHRLAAADFASLTPIPPTKAPRS